MNWHTIFIAISVLPAIVNGRFYSKEDELLDWLNAECSLKARGRPVRNITEPVFVEIRMIPYEFRGLNDKEQSFSLLTEIDLTWKHPCVEWGQDKSAVDANRWMMVPRLQIMAKDYWRPILAHVNAISHANFLDTSAKTTPLLIYPNGNILWQVITVVDSFCKLNFKHFPFDEQTCEVLLESTFESFAVSVLMGEDGIRISSALEDFISEAAVWQLVEMDARIKNKTYPEWDGEYHRAVFTFRLIRRPGLYVVNIFLPCLCLAILQLAAVLMPPRFPDRPIYNITVVLAFAILQTSISDSIPKSLNVPYITVFLAAQVIIGMLCTVYSLVACALATRHPQLHWFRLLRACNVGISSVRILDIVCFGIVIFATLITDTATMYLMLKNRL